MDLNKLKLNKLIEEISYLKEAEELLKQMYMNIGVYNLEVLDSKFDYPKPLSMRIREHFNFDDNE